MSFPGFNDSKLEQEEKSQPLFLTMIVVFFSLCLLICAICVAQLFCSKKSNHQQVSWIYNTMTAVLLDNFYGLQPLKQKHINKFTFLLKLLQDFNPWFLGTDNSDNSVSTEPASRGTATTCTPNLRFFQWWGLLWKRGCPTDHPDQRTNRAGVQAKPGSWYCLQLLTGTKCGFSRKDLKSHTELWEAPTAQSVC